MKTRKLGDHNNYKGPSRETKRIEILTKGKTSENIGENLRKNLQGTRELIYNITLSKNYRERPQPPTCVMKDPKNGAILTGT